MSRKEVILGKDFTDGLTMDAGDPMKSPISVHSSLGGEDTEVGIEVKVGAEERPALTRFFACDNFIQNFNK